VSTTETTSPPATSQVPAIPLPVLVIFRGIGQIWFQENALTGLLFVLGIAICFPIQAIGIVLGAAIGTGIAWGLKYDKNEFLAGIYGFNPALVGIATFFFFELSGASILLMLVGCAVSTVLTWAVRKHVPFPTYTAPFVVTTWAIFLIGQSMGLAAPASTANLIGTPETHPKFEAVLHGVGQVMFQASIWTGVLFLAGLAVSNKEHAVWSLFAAFLGMLVAGYHLDAADRALDPERLIERFQFVNVQLGLYGYNATLAAVALFLWKRSFLIPLLGIIISVPLTEIVPRFGIPALTAPFVLATWIVLALLKFESKLFPSKPLAA
jgi:urea transporter